MAGILQQAKTAMFAATIPNVTFSVPDKLPNHWFTCKKRTHNKDPFAYEVTLSKSTIPRGQKAADQWLIGVLCE